MMGFVGVCSTLLIGPATTSSRQLLDLLFACGICAARVHVTNVSAAVACAVALKVFIHHSHTGDRSVAWKTGQICACCFFNGSGPAGPSLLQTDTLEMVLETLSAHEFWVFKSRLTDQFISLASLKCMFIFQAIFIGKCLEELF